MIQVFSSRASVREILEHLQLKKRKMIDDVREELGLKVGERYVMAPIFERLCLQGFAVRSLRPQNGIRSHSHSCQPWEYRITRAGIAMRKELAKKEKEEAIRQKRVSLRLIFEPSSLP